MSKPVPSDDRSLAGREAQANADKAHEARAEAMEERLRAMTDEEYAEYERTVRAAVRAARRAEQAAYDYTAPDVGFEYGRKA